VLPNNDAAFAAYCQNNLCKIKHKQIKLQVKRNFVAGVCALPSCTRVEYYVGQFQYCGGCKLVKYCCQQHQREHWKAGHKLACGKKQTSASSIIADDLADGVKMRFNRLVCPGHDRESLSRFRSIPDVFGKLKPMPNTRGAWALLLDPAVVEPALDKLERQALKKNLRKRDLKKLLGKVLERCLFIPEQHMLTMAATFCSRQRLELEQALAAYDSTVDMVLYYEVKTSEDDCRRWIECLSTKTYKTASPADTGGEVAFRQSALGAMAMSGESTFQHKLVTVRTLESEMRDALPPNLREDLRIRMEAHRKMKEGLIALREAVGHEEFDSQPALEGARHDLAICEAIDRQGEEGMAGIPMPPNLLSFLASKNKCEHCGVEKKQGVKFRKCDKCKATYYCSAVCQRAHWKAHKVVCAYKGLLCAEIARNT
jgi:hypothetical protein